MNILMVKDLQISLLKKNLEKELEELRRERRKSNRENTLKTRFVIGPHLQRKRWITESKLTLIKRLIRTYENFSHRSITLINISFLKVKISKANLTKSKNKPFLLETTNLTKNKFLTRWSNLSI